jgi:23S rRNA pseudouridine1911/1915/1917 synthase
MSDTEDSNIDDISGEDSSSELVETVYEIHSAANADRIRLDKFITRSVQNASRNKVQQLIEAGGVEVNGTVVLKTGRVVLPGDVVICHVPRPPPQDIEPEDIPLDIVYEDEALIIVNKKAGMVTHPAFANYSGTLVNALMYHTAHLSQERGEQRAGIVHRLDKDTSGLLVVAKTEFAHAFISRQFAERTIQREYNAIVWGRFQETRGEIEAPLARHKSDRKKMAVVEGGKHAVTRFEVIREYSNHTLLKLKLLTGRTHQIRVHLLHVHHPVFGDPTYRGRHISYGNITREYKAFVNNMLELLPRQALHAKTLGFVHPLTREEVFFESELPDDMKQALSKLERYESGKAQ